LPDNDESLSIEKDEEKDDEEYKAIEYKNMNESLINRRKYLKFRRIYEFERPKKVKTSEYYFKFNNCDNLLIRYTLEDNGFKESTKHEPNIIWSNWSIQSTIYNSLSRYTKVNHFPNSIELTRKDNMYKNISRLQLN